MPFVGLFLRAIGAGVAIGAAWARAQNLKDLANYVDEITTAIITYVNDFVNVELWAEIGERNAWHGTLGPESQRFAGNLVQAFRNVDGSLKHIVYGILPNSTHQVGGSLGRLWSLTQAIRKDVYRIDGLEQGLIYNVDRIILPQIKGWEQFTKWWDHNFSHSAGLLMKWVSHPGDLSGRLAPTMAPDVVGQLGAQGNRTLRDQLARLLLSAGPDVVSAIDQAAVAVLNSGSY